MIPTIPGVPSWGAVLIAVTFAAIGFAIDAGSGDKELGLAFAAAYVIGCVAAVVAVRQTGVFTAVIQPPLLLFVSVPGAYFLFHSGAMDGLKDLLINCGYPLIERFPLMFFTSAVVLLIGLLRWYQGMGRRAATAEPTESQARGAVAALTAKISHLLSRDAAHAEADDEAPPPRRSRQHSIDRGARTTRASKTSGTSKTSKTATASSRTRSGKPVKRTQPSRSRHTRPPETEIIEPVVERPRRPRTTTRRSTDPPVPPPESRRRTRSSSSSTREPRKQPPASERRARYQRPDRHSRFDGFEPFEPHGTSGPNGNGSLNGTHHPVSRVRYRGADDGEQRAQYRSQQRPSRHSAEAWEYDV